MVQRIFFNRQANSSFLDMISLVAFAVYSTLVVLASAGGAPTKFIPRKSSSCPTDLCPSGGTLPEGSYISPSLMVIVNKDRPNKIYGATDRPKLTADEYCTIFNLELDQRAYNKTCNLVFDLPSHQQTETQYTYSGDGTFTFTGYAIGVGANLTTSYAQQPAKGPDPPSPPPTLKPGNSYIINSAACGIPEGVPPVTVSGMLCSSDTDFEFFQSNLTCPIGFFVVLS
jgi:hypothetical protein